MVLLCSAATPIVPSLLDKKRRRAARLGLPRPRSPLGVQVWEPVDAHAAGDQTKQVPRRPHPWNNSRRPPAVRACNTSPRVAAPPQIRDSHAHMLCDRFCMGCHGIKTMADPALRMCWIYDAKNSRHGGAANNGGHQPALPRILRRSKLASHSSSLWDGCQQRIFWKVGGSFRRASRSDKVRQLPWQAH